MINQLHYTLFRGKNNQFYWNLKAPNHEIVCQSEGYTTKQSAQNGIDAVRRYAGGAVIQDNA